MVLPEFLSLIPFWRAGLVLECYEEHNVDFVSPKTPIMKAQIYIFLMGQRGNFVSL
jgi:hypothetical protein